MMISETYKDMEVRYLEDNNQWGIYEDQSLTHRTDSLRKAREWIDRYKKKPMKRRPVFFCTNEWNNTGLFEKVDLTSINPYKKHYSNSFDCTIVYNGRRSKVKTSDVYEATKANEKKVGEINAIVKKIQSLRKRKEDLTKLLDPIQPPTPIEEE
jgi:hypothetical protein